MKKTFIILLACFIGFAALTGCEDFLEAENKSLVTAGEQFKTKDGFENLINQAYFTLRELYNDEVVYSAGTDLYVGIRSAGDPAFETYALTSDNSNVKELYIDLYASVIAANAVLYYAGICEDYEEKELRKEEARFIRAYAYFVLSQQFGGVPLIKDYINTAETSYPRNTLTETYEFIFTELEELSVSALLPASDLTGRASVQAAKALLAKAYLAAGWDLETTLTDADAGTYTVNGSSYFNLAASTAKEVADAVTLTMPFEDKWSPFNEQNEEIIFAVQWDRATMLNGVDDGNSHQRNFGTYLGNVTLGLKSVQSNYNPTSKAFYLYEQGDERYDATFMTTILNYSGDETVWDKQGYWAYYNATAEEQANLGIAFYFPAWYTTDQEITDFQTANANRFVSEGLKNRTQIIRTAEPVRWIIYNADGTEKSDEQSINYNDALTRVGAIPTIKKFDDPATSVKADGDNSSYRNLVVLNMSDIYLVAAEAYLLADKEGEALNYINKVRERAGATILASFAAYQRFDPKTQAYVNTEQNIDVILDERARELMGEYHRWMDLRRTHQLVRYNLEWNVNFNRSLMVGGDGNIKWLRPIPADEIGLNTGISTEDQNPGYTGVVSNE